MVDQKHLMSILSSFKPRHFVLFKDAISTVDGAVEVADTISKYLIVRSEDHWIDFESIEMLGYDIGKVSTDEFVNIVSNSINDKLGNSDISSAFLIKLNEGREHCGAIKNSLPTQIQVDKLVNALKSEEIEESKALFTPVIQQTISYFEKTGDYLPVRAYLNEVFYQAQNLPEESYASFHYLMCDAIVDLFTIDCSDPKLWLRWANSFSKMGDHENAQSILWEAFRRRPDSEPIAFTLIRAMSAARYELQNAIRFADFCRKRFYFNPRFELQAIVVRSHSKFERDIVTSIHNCMLLLKRLGPRDSDSRMGKVFRDATSLFSALINRHWGFLNDNDKAHWNDIVEKLYSMFSNRMDVLGVIAYRLAMDHRNWDAITALYSENTDEIILNTMAKLSASYFSGEGVDRAISILENCEGPISKTHLAKILVHRAQPQDIRNAEKILRDVLFADPANPYATAQLAALLYVHQQGSGRSEALQLLEEIEDSTESLNLVEAIQKNEPITLNYVGEIVIQRDEGRIGDIEPHDRVSFKDYSEPAAFGYRLPNSVVENAQLKRWKFESEWGTSNSATTAKRKLQELTISSNNEYMNFLIGLQSSCKDNGSASVGILGAKLLKSMGNNNQDDLLEIVRLASRLAPTAELLRSIYDSERPEQYNLVDSDTGFLSWERRMASIFQGSRFVKNITHKMSLNSMEYKESNDNEIADIVGAFVTLECISM